MRDKYGRNINYLRLSISNRCNFNCFFCSPSRATACELTLDELRYFSEIFSALGIEHVRITGGEPLLRRDLPQILEMFSKNFQLSVTTNGSLLKDLARTLSKFNVRSINLSLHSLDEEKFYRMTCGNLSEVLEGLNAALKEKLNVKLNCVVNQHNVGEIPDLVRFATELKVPIRFIELMPIGQNNESVPLSQIMDHLKIFDLKPVNIKLGFGPANYYITKDGNYVGIIAALSKNFCQFCNKVRVSGEGKLYPCLGSSFCADLRELLRTGSKEEVLRVLRTIIESKPFKHNMERELVQNSMKELGG